MKLDLPIILRKDHNEIVRQMKINECRLVADIVLLKKELEERDKDVEALMAQLTSPAEKEKKKDDLLLIPNRGRSGWRSRVKMMSEATRPKDTDSMKQLEDRVKKEGGTI